MSKVLVVGDYMYDINYFCEATRLCPEAPAPVLVVSRKEISHGGAGLVVENLLSLGSHVDALFPSRSDKKRFFVGHQLLFRVDRDSYRIDPEDEILGGLLQFVKKKPDAVIISDYGKGGISRHIARYLIETGLPIFVDTKGKDPTIYSGAYVVFPNRAELEDWRGRGIRLRSEHTIVKLGAEGCLLDEKPIPTEPQQVYDVTGAGDVFLAAFVHRWLELQVGELVGTAFDLLRECASFANRAAGISVRHLGTYVVKKEELYGSR